ncbi:MAG: VOC family protein [Brevundimonas sp.]|uniref:VOC family protein n=1 Tax=Brevundimonas sp. TaxID=1871086 RepID=UPI0028D3D5F4|nr:VOC family protein [uncultured Brevundimonas sp.]
MKITPNLMFHDNAREAFGFYAEVLGAGQLNLITFAEMPEAPVGPEWKDKIAHAWMQIGDQAIMGSDSPPGVCADDGGHRADPPRTPPAQTSVALHFDSVDQARTVFDRLSENDLVQMPFAATSWSAGFGMTRDRFGKDWMINTFPQEHG